MIFQRVNPDTVSLKIGSATVLMHSNGDIKINDRALEGPGEYDIAGVGAHVVGDVAVLFSEGIRVAVFYGSNPQFSDDESDIEVFLFFIQDPKKINELVKGQEPRIVVLTDEAVANELAQADSISFERQGNYKVTSQTLPVSEGAAYILLA